MEHFITRLVDPDPETGNRMIPTGAWFHRPDTMKQERAFLRDNQNARMWHVITDITVCGDGYHLVFDGTREPVHVEAIKVIYITEDQHERFRDFHNRKMRADAMLAEIPEEFKASAIALIERMTLMDNFMPDQLEHETVDGDLKDLQERAWGVVDKNGNRVTFLPLVEISPMENSPSQALRFADNANPAGVPHRWRSYFA